MLLSKRLAGIVLILSLGVLHQLKAQDYSIKGVVSDTNATLLGAHVSLSFITGADTIKKHSITDENGKFIFENLSSGAYVLDITFLGYDSYSKKVEVTSQNLNLNTIKLNPSAKMLNAVEVKSRAMVYVGDTLQYSINHVNVLPGATARDILKKLPGMKVTSNGVQAQGQKVTRVHVDGKPFFSNDPNNTINTVPAEMIEKVQVYEQGSKRSELTGYDDGEKTQTINFITRPDKRRGSLNSVTAGYGNDNNYLVNGGIKYFSRKKRVGISGGANNLSNSLLASNSGVDIERAFRNNGGNGTYTHYNLNGSYQKYSNKVKVRLNYKYLNKNVNKERLSRTYYYQQGDSSHYTDNLLNSDNKTASHFITFNSDYKINKSDNLNVRLSANVRDNTIKSDNITVNYQDSAFINKVGNSINGINQIQGLTGNFIWRHSFKSNKQNFLLRYGINYNNNISDDNTFNNYSDIENVDSNSVKRDLRTERLNNSLNNTLGAEFNGTFLKKQKYHFEYSISKQLKETSDYTFTEVIQSLEQLNIDTNQSIEYGHVNTYNKAIIGTNLDIFGIKVNAQFLYQTKKQEQEKLFPQNGEFSRLYTSYLPSVSISYRYKRSGRFSLDYRTSSNTPSISQLQNTINNKNPLFISSGNPDLKQTYSHSVSGRASLLDIFNSNSIFFSGRLNYTNNSVSNYTFFAQNDTVYREVTMVSGSQYSYPINTCGSKRANVSLQYQIPLEFIKSDIDFGIKYDFSDRPGFVNNNYVLSKSKRYLCDVQLFTGASEKIEYSLYGSMGIENNINENLEFNYTNYVYNASSGLKWMVTNLFNFHVFVSYYSNRSGHRNFDSHTANFLVNQYLTKKRNWSLSLIGFDVFNTGGNFGYQHNMFNSTEYTTNRMNRYFLLTLTYKFNHFKSQK